MNSTSYLLRVSVKVLGKEPVKGLDEEPSITIGKITVTVKQRWPFLILLARDFATEAEAESFLPKLKGGLWTVAIELNIAFKPFFELRSITRSSDPEQAARNLAKSSGQAIKEPVDPVHGLTEEEGYTIFRSDENIRYVAIGDVSAYVSTSWERFSTTLAVGVENARVPADRSHDLATAIDLYLASFYEISIRARLLTLMTCLEVLAPVTERHTTAIRALSTFKGQLETQLAQANGAEERDALEALAREIDFKKETSIRRRLRALILSEAPLDGDAKTALAKKVVDAYDLRGGIVHTGLVASQALHRAHETTLEAVKLLLRARLSIARNGPMSPR